MTPHFSQYFTRIYALGSVSHFNRKQLSTWAWERDIYCGTSWSISCLLESSRLRTAHNAATPGSLVVPHFWRSHTGLWNGKRNVLDFPCCWPAMGPTFVSTVKADPQPSSMLSLPELPALSLTSPKAGPGQQGRQRGINGHYPSHACPSQLYNPPPFSVLAALMPSHWLTFQGCLISSLSMQSVQAYEQADRKWS